MYLWDVFLASEIIGPKIYYFIIIIGHMADGILALTRDWTYPPAVKTQNHNQWTAREIYWKFCI